MEKILEAKNIYKNYPGVTALEDVNFNVYKGKVNVLVGENGAGKSTLMKILAGVEKQTSGTILLKNKELDINSTKDAEKNSIGIIHQELNLFPNNIDISTKVMFVNFGEKEAVYCLSLLKLIELADN